MWKWIALLALSPALWGQRGENVLLVVNRGDPLSSQIAGYYRPRRSVPAANVCTIDAGSAEAITWDFYVSRVERPIAACLSKGGLRERTLYIVLAMNAPLKVDGEGNLMNSERSSVDSELALLYGKMKGVTYPRAGRVTNPFFGRRDAAFQRPQFPIYLVTRLGAFDLADAKAMIDRSLAARNRGKFVIDASAGNSEGNTWLRNAAMLLPKSRVILDTAPSILYDETDVIGYASWGSNDNSRTKRHLGFSWLPGGIATEYVSTNARTLKRPPDSWAFAGESSDVAHLFAGSAQSLAADYLHDGATGASGNTYEPFLNGCARPDYLLPAYFEGRNLAESYYLALPFLSWQGVVLGDPLCSLGKP